MARILIVDEQETTRQALRDLLRRHGFETTEVENLGTAFEQVQGGAEGFLHDVPRFNQGVLDALTTHICVLDEAGKILAVNRAWREFAAANPLLGQNVDLGADYFAVCEAATGEDAATARETLRGLRAVSQCEMPEFVLEYPCHSPNTQRWFELRATRLTDGVSRHLVVAHTNVTERKLAEAALRASEDRFRAIADHTADLECWFGPDGKLLWVNPAVEQITGYSVAECLAMPGFPLPLIAEEDRARNRASFQEGLGGTRGNDWEFRFVRKDGTRRWGSVSWRPIFANDGTHLGHRSSVRDITKRKQTEEVLRASEDRFRSLFEASLDAAFLTAPDGRTLAANAAACRMFGRSEKELQRLGRNGVVDTSDPRLQTALEERDRIGRFAGELTFLRQDGTKFPGEVSSAVFRNQAGEMRTSIVIREVTERKQAEQRMQRFSHEILAAREEERKQVSAILHHDVGSLAVGVSAHLEAVEEDLRCGKCGDALKWLNRTRKLFDESVVRLKELAVELRPPELDVIGLSAALRQHFSQVTKGGSLRIHFREALGRRRVSGDAATILFRVAQEALTNAITHGRAKLVNVGLRASKAKVTLAVRDNGRGFDPSKNRVQATSPMGLRVMREMATFAGGDFAIDSARGRGTIVRVSLPLEVVALGARDATVRKPTVASGKTARAAGRGSQSQKRSRA